MTTARTHFHPSIAPARNPATWLTRLLRLIGAGR